MVDASSVAAHRLSHAAAVTFLADSGCCHTVIVVLMQKFGRAAETREPNDLHSETGT